MCFSKRLVGLCYRYSKVPGENNWLTVDVNTGCQIPKTFTQCCKNFNGIHHVIKLSACIFKWHIPSNAPLVSDSNRYQSNLVLNLCLTHHMFTNCTLQSSHLRHILHKLLTNYDKRITNYVKLQTRAHFSLNKLMYYCELHSIITMNCLDCPRDFGLFFALLLGYF